MPEAESRYLLGPCMHNRHAECPGSKLREKYTRDKVLGLIPSGKTERVYCECPHHAEGT